MRDSASELEVSAVSKWQEPPEAQPELRGKECDLASTCPTCMIEMHPEHAHYRCPRCGYRDSCCF